MRHKTALTCQCTLWFSAGNSTLEISRVTWKRRANVVVSVPSSERSVLSRDLSVCKYLTLVVNCTPVLITSGRSGCMGIHGCLSTTNALQCEEQITRHVQIYRQLFISRYQMIKSNVLFKPLHKIAEQVHYFFLQSGAVLNDGISFIRDLLLKLFQLLDLLSDLQLWLGQWGYPERKGSLKQNSTACQVVMGQLSRTMSLNGPGRCWVVLRCRRSAVSSSSRPVPHLSGSSARNPWQKAGRPSRSLFAAEPTVKLWWWSFTPQATAVQNILYIILEWNCWEASSLGLCLTLLSWSKALSICSSWAIFCLVAAAWLFPFRSCDSSEKFHTERVMPHIIPRLALLRIF